MKIGAYITLVTNRDEGWLREDCPLEARPYVIADDRFRFRPQGEDRRVTAR